jgi:hypothetical protein
VVAKPLAKKKIFDLRHRKKIMLVRLSLFAFNMLFAGMICILSSCSAPTMETELLETITPTNSATILPSFTPQPSETQTPSITPNPFGTPINNVKWPEEGDLMQTVDIRVIFGESLDDLPSGAYLLYKDPTTRGLHYTSLDGSHQGMLFAFDPPYSVATFRRSRITSRIVGLFELGIPTRYIIDLSHQVVHKLGPFCNEFIGSMSPLGQWIAGVCQVYGDEPRGTIEIELISLEDGSGYHLEVPTLIEKLYTEIPLYWITDERFISLVAPDKEPCLFDIPALGMRCAPMIKNKRIHAISKKWLVVRRSEGNNRILEIFPMSCFQDEDECEPVTLELESISSTRFRLSPDGTMLALDEGNHLTSTTAKIGYYDTASWTYHEVGIFSRDFGLFDWCPDSTCMLIVGEPSYIAYLDGSMEQLKFNPGHPLALIAIP